MPEVLTYLKALADETRLRLMNVLSRHELSVNELVDILAMGQPRVSRHLKIMTEAGLLAKRRDGVRVYYSVAKAGRGRGFIEAVASFVDEEDVFVADLDRAEAAVAERTLATQRFFDAHAGDWDRLRTEVLGDFELAAAVSARMPDCGVAVDLGCGDGHLLPALLERAEGVIGVDSSAKMLELARRRFIGDGGRVSLRIGRLEHLPLADGEADFAVTTMVLHHLSQPLAGIKEARRALKTGGLLMVVDFDKHTNERMRVKYGDMWLGFSREEIETWLEEAGFRVRDVERFSVNEGLTVQMVMADKE